MRHFFLLALGAIALLIPSAHAREQQDLKERVRDAVQRTDKDLGNLVHREKLNDQQRDRFDAAVKDLHEVVRQQWNFSPHGTTEELEDYTVDLSGVTAVELRIDPDRSHDPTQSQNYASLQSLKLA